MGSAKLDPKAVAAQSDGLITAFGAALGQDAITDPLRRFVAQAGEDWSAEELPGFDPADVAHALTEFWTFGETATDPLSIRVRPARRADGTDLKSDLLEIVQPDRPFLVDSIMGAVAEHGFSVRAMFHPVIDTPAGRRSMIQVYLAPVGEDREAALVEGVREAPVSYTHLTLPTKA